VTEIGGSLLVCEFWCGTVVKKLEIFVETKTLTTTVKIDSKGDKL